jgi:hypothetical protein
MSDVSTHNGHTEEKHDNVRAEDDRPGQTADESAYLNEETAATKQAIADDLERLKSSLADAVDPIAWAKEHPWISLALAVAAGFTAGAVLNPFGEPKKQEEPEEEFDGDYASEDYVDEEPPPQQPKRRPRRAASRGPARHPSLSASAMSMIFEPLFEMIKVALTSLLVASVKRYTDPLVAEPPPYDDRDAPDTTVANPS